MNEDVKLFTPNPRKQAGPDQHTRELQNTILSCRKNGMTFPAIATHLDLSVPWVHKQYRKALNSIIVENVADVRKIELERLDSLQDEVMKVFQTIHPLVAGGRVVYDVLEGDNGATVVDEEGTPVMVKLHDHSVKLAAVNSALKIMERRAKLLGLDTPSKVAFTDPDGGKQASFVQFYLPSNGRDESDLQPE